MKRKDYEAWIASTRDARMDWWRKARFGMFVHFGLYSILGRHEWVMSMEGIDKEDYEKLADQFLPEEGCCEKWAKLAKKAGMKYMVLTTRHHEGFSLWDSKVNPYNSVNYGCHRDIVKEFVEACHKYDLKIGFYSSIMDWHHPDYWAEQWATPDRNVNYDPQRYPERWQSFCDFTYNQIHELTHNYGDIDILWLDGGWVRPEYSLNDEYRSWLGCKGYIQDIDMPKIAAMARENNPDLIIVDRTVHGKYENYQTPEQQVPDTLLPFPWETCMSMGDSWSYVETDNYKSTNKIVHLLVDVVAKGGNYLLNVGPSPEGELPPTAVERMHEIGNWMKINGEAIYGTRPFYPYCDGKVRFTQKNGKIYAVYMLDEGETMPNSIKINAELNKNKVKILGSKAKAKLTKTADGYLININGDVKLEHAVVFELK